MFKTKQERALKKAIKKFDKAKMYKAKEGEIKEFDDGLFKFTNGEWRPL